MADNDFAEEEVLDFDEEQEQQVILETSEAGSVGAPRPGRASAMGGNPPVVAGG